MLAVLDGRSLAREPGAEPLVQALTLTTLRHRLLLEWARDQFLKKPLRRRDRDLNALLLIGLAELSFFSTPTHAAVNETVAGCGGLGKPWARKLVNGVLRSFLRSPYAAADQLAAAVADPAVRFSHPRWLVDRLTAAWPDHAEDLLRANNEPGRLVLRINRQRSTVADYRQKLAAQGIEAEAMPLAPDALLLAKAVPVEALPAFEAGAASVQDAAAQLAAPLLDPKPGQRVLDACAAPGGKTAHLKEYQPDCQVTAIDSDPVRCQRIDSGLARLGLAAEVAVADAAEWSGGPYERILLDAPCSATGVIRRHPDIKWLRRDDDIAPLADLQRRLLTHLWTRLAVGGCLLYATCSLLPEENHLTIRWFTEATADVRLLPLEVSWGLDTGFGRQLLPGMDGTDGFFYALLEKTGRA